MLESVADSDAVRSQRKRLHAAGDHFLCRHGVRARVLGLGGTVVALPAPSGVPVDPRNALESLARRLEGASEADPGNALIARELRMTLQALAGADPDAGFDVG